MLHLVVIILSCLVDPGIADRVHRFDKPDLTSDQQREHVAAAVVAQFVTGERAGAVLAIARGESDYTADAVKIERSGSLSCGVVQATAIDRADCDRIRSSLAEGYLAGARQLREHRTSRKCGGSLACGLAGYAGGGHAIDFCRANPHHLDCWKAVTARLRLADWVEAGAPSS